MKLVLQSESQYPGSVPLPGPDASPSEWADAAAAASAARMYSERARAAAESAQRYASPQPGRAVSPECWR